ncbi:MULTISPECIES: hypothetical protein [Enterobacter]|uniref:hypothetical protein n=1 Tax=Enterobacter TaxID=547 RepID=UPI00073CE1CB|nr:MULTISPECIES: hypothetical protein [Enterobacter]EKS6932074.1 hypothetical protein [Enterobacter bugandensis]EKV5175236.1 hypothetical protein [Enterobacter bugandensis]KSX59042.1 hypothetical protein APT89_01755 [Enterobacter sp. 50588862]MBE4812810.1 hypothetical protein [Enterobacter cloacae complex sp. P44RS]MBE4828643.1 hypothetical protein [Enterobacter cloacae complex sp. P42RS]
MYYSEDIINKIGTDKELAVRLDKAMAGVKDGFIEYVNNLGDGATRALYYTSCFTENYKDVCKQLGNEDKRFLLGLYELVKHRNIIFRMILIYVQTLLKSKNESEKDIILRKVVPPTTHYSVMQASRFALVYSVVKYICYGSKINGVIQSAMMKKIGGLTSGGLIALSTYGTVQHAADSAHNLKYFLPLFYNALYSENLEMMYFLIEPVVLDVGYLNISTASNADIINALKRMAGL